MGFNKEDKIRWEELAPSLQEIFNGVSSSITNLNGNINNTANNSVTDVSVSDNGTFIILTKGDGSIKTVLNIDTELSKSINPVQNKAIYTTILSINNTLSSMNARLTSLDSNNSSLSNRITKLESTVSSLISNLSNMESNIASIASRVSALEAGSSGGGGSSTPTPEPDNTHGCPGK